MDGSLLVLTPNNTQLPSESKSEKFGAEMYQA